MFYVTVLLLVYFCDQFVASEIRHSRRHCTVFVNDQHGIQRRVQDFNKNTQMYTVIRVDELKSAHLKCNFLAFSSISGIIAE